jgi:uncharacterized protein YjbI with pentapeptide repeats
MRRWLDSWPVRRRTQVTLFTVVFVVLATWGLTSLGVLPTVDQRTWDRTGRYVRAHWGGILLLALAVVAAVLAVSVLHSWWRDRRRPAGSQADGAGARDWTKITAQVTAFTALAALIFTGLSLWASRSQLAIAEEGQLTDRYSRAVDQIGASGPENLQVRLGGIYALERLANDSRRDRDSIVDVLSAFVRSTSPRTDKPCPEKVPVDVQAAFVVLMRRPAAVREYEAIDLQKTCLTGVDASNARVESMSFVGADLSRSSFYQAHVALVSFSGAVLRQARFDGLTSGGFLFMPDADMTGANLREADLHSVDFGRTVLNGADLSGADLSGADLTGTTHDASTVTKDVRTSAETKGVWW